MPSERHIKAKLRRRQFSIPRVTAFPEFSGGGFDTASALNDLSQALQAGVNLYSRKLDERDILRADQAEIQLRTDLALDNTLTELAFYEMHPDMPWLPGLGDSIRPIIGSVKGNNDASMTLADFGDKMETGQLSDAKKASDSLDKALSEYAKQWSDNPARVSGYAGAIEEQRQPLLRQAAVLEGGERVKDSYRTLGEGYESALERLSEGPPGFLVDEFDKLTNVHSLTVPGGEREREAILHEVIRKAGLDKRYQGQIRAVVEELLRRDTIKSPDIERQLATIPNSVDSLMDTVAGNEERAADRAREVAIRKARVDLAKNFDPTTGEFTDQKRVQKIIETISGGDLLVVQARERGVAIATGQAEGSPIPTTYWAARRAQAVDDPEGAVLMVEELLPAIYNEVDLAKAEAFLAAAASRDARTGQEAEGTSLAARGLRDELDSQKGLDLDSDAVAGHMEHFYHMVEEGGKTPSEARHTIKKQLKDEAELQQRQEEFSRNPQPTTPEGINLRREDLLKVGEALQEQAATAATAESLTAAHYRNLRGPVVGEELGAPAVGFTSEETREAARASHQAKRESVAAADAVLKNNKQLLDLERWEQTVLEEKVKDPNPEQALQTSFWTNTEDDTILRMRLVA